jgi:hypothetical protein
MGLCLIAFFVLSWRITPAAAENGYPSPEASASFPQDTPFVSIIPQGIYTHLVESSATITSLHLRLPRTGPWEHLFGFFDKENTWSTLPAADAGGVIWQDGTFDAPNAPAQTAPAQTASAQTAPAPFAFEQINSKKISGRRNFLMDIIHPVFDALDYWHLGVTHNEPASYPEPVQPIDAFSDQGITNLFAFSSAVLFTKQGYRFLQGQPWASDQLVDKIKKMNFFIVPSGGLLLKYNFKF